MQKELFGHDKEPLAEPIAIYSAVVTEQSATQSSWVGFAPSTHLLTSGT